MAVLIKNKSDFTNQEFLKNTLKDCQELVRSKEVPDSFLNKFFVIITRVLVDTARFL